MTVVLPECAFVEPLATGHTHPDELHVGYRGGLWQQHFMILSHLLQMTAYLLNTLTRRQPFHLVVNMPLLLTIHGWMDEMAQLLVSRLIGDGSRRVRLQPVIRIRPVGDRSR